jgi:hypothetical protein
MLNAKCGRNLSHINTPKKKIAASLVEIATVMDAILSIHYAYGIYSNCDV